MEPFRVKRGTERNRRRILVATSFGISSTAIVDILHWHRALQLERARRSEYDVVVVHVDETVLEGGESNVEERLEALRQRYTQFEFEGVLLQDIYEYGGAVEESVTAAAEAGEPNGSSASISQEALRSSIFIRIQSFPGGYNIDITYPTTGGSRKEKPLRSDIVRRLDDKDGADGPSGGHQRPWSCIAVADIRWSNTIWYFNIPPPA
ncbi:hypothetical protein ABW19_dt0207278 [Dactylella cylindrospora]|nr:hypothetical protein ABW19_dt0207278 [Dactylella cylindrospora]